MPVETGEMTLTISKLRVPCKNKKLKKVYHLHMQLPISSESSPSISAGLTIGRIFLNYTVHVQHLKGIQRSKQGTVKTRV